MRTNKTYCRERESKEVGRNLNVKFEGDGLVEGSCA